MTAKTHRPLLELFTTYDAGLHDLPPEMVAARDAVRRVEAALDALPIPPRPGDLEHPTARELADLARTRDVHLDLTPFHELEQARHDHDLSTRVLRLALDQAAATLAHAVHTHGDDAIRDHLAPAFDKTVTEAVKAVDAYRRHGNTTAAILRAPAPARTAWNAVDDLAAKFVALRDARSRIVRITGQPQQDQRGDFSLIRNAEQMWPALLDSGRYQFGMRSPWADADTRALFEWLHDTPAAEPWLPTATEQDNRWQQVFGPRVAQMAANRHGAEAFMAAMGGRS